MDPIKRETWDLLPALTSLVAGEIKAQVEEALRRGQPVYVVEGDDTLTRVTLIPWRHTRESLEQD